MIHLRERISLSLLECTVQKVTLYARIGAQLATQDGGEGLEAVKNLLTQSRRSTAPPSGPLSRKGRLDG